MKADAVRSCAPAHRAHEANQDWEALERVVFRLQVRIAKAAREGRFGKVRALQWLLTHSHAARCLAVRQVTRNAGRHTPGIDGVVWRKASEKRDAVKALRRHGYRPSPLRRVHIPKRNGKLRPLGIPTMHDRAMQALHAMALLPVAEVKADPNSYGFRPKRSTADALAQCFITLAKRCSPCWVLDADIQACFDRISHDWLLAHIPMDRRLLRSWLHAGVIEADRWHPTMAGTPQGGIISPTLMNLTLDGLEAAAQSAGASRGAKINVIRYADDFIITGASESVLREQVMPAVTVFLAERGLALSAEKTRIVHLDEGCNFLGFNLRKYDGTLLMQPAKDAVRRFELQIKAWVRQRIHWPEGDLVRSLNAKLRGWALYYRHGVAKRTFGRIDHTVYRILQGWTRRRHPEKTARWRFARYWRRDRGRWRFCATGGMHPLSCFRLSELPIRRHLKIQAQATPFDPTYREYFRRRWQQQRQLRKLDRMALTQPRSRT